MENKVNYLEWSDITRIVNQMAIEIEKNYKPDIIISIVRGGMVPSVILSHLLNVRDVVNIISKETESDEINAKKQKIDIDKNINLNNLEGKKVLIVDDIVGSGQTIREIKEIIKKWNPKDIKVAVCLINEENWKKSNIGEYKSIVDYLGESLRGWVVFPWEKQGKEF